MPTNVLKLPAYVVTAFQENDHDYHVSAETVAPPRVCPHCRSDDIVGFGRREQMVRDVSMHGKRVGLYVRVWTPSFARAAAKFIKHHGS